jgi:serine/threonine-protein kinase
VQRAGRLVAHESRLPALLRGEEKPKNASEGLELADLAYVTKHPDLSARLYADAFRAEPRLTEDVATGNRYNAACSAALAAAGRWEEKTVLNDQAKARWRKQALDWLEADRAHWSRRAEAGSPEAKALITQTLRHWKSDPDLAGIRDDVALKALPDDEQKACRALWAEVDKVLKMATP